MPYEDKPTKTIAQLAQESRQDTTSRNRKAFLIMGPPGTGKTNSLKTIPPESKALLIDSDNKADCLKKEIDEGIIDRVDIWYSPETYRETFGRICDVELDLLSKKDYYLFGMVDSLTTLYALVERKSLDVLGGDKVTWDHMSWIDACIWGFLYRLIGTIPYVILTAHEDIRGDSDATMKVVPFARKALSNSMPGRFKEIYHATTIGDGDNVCYIWETRPHGIYGCNTLISSLPFQVPNHFDLLLSTDWDNVKSVDEAVLSYEKRTKRRVTKWKI